jgi:hypothetical protein
MSLKRWRALILISVMGWIGYVGAVNAVIVYFAHDLGKDSPATKLVPTPLPTTQIADLAAGTMVREFGYTIQLPWMSPLKKLDLKTASMFTTNDDATMMFFDPSSHLNGRKFYDANSTMSRVLGTQAMSSAYQLFLAEMTSTPEQVQLWHTRAFNVRVMTLLYDKTMFALDGTSAIHPIFGEHARGYEAVMTKKGRNIVHLELFDDKDRELEIMLSWYQGTASALTDEQINAIVASIQIPSAGCVTPHECS